MSLDLNDIEQKSKASQKKVNEQLTSNDKEEIKYDFDPLKMYFGEPYDVILEDGKIIRIIQPTIGNILEWGETRVYSSITPFTANTTMFRLQLWDMGVDWNKISDFELFGTFSKQLKKEDSELLFKGLRYIENPDYNEDLSEEENNENGNPRLLEKSWDIDFTKLNSYTRNRVDENGEVVLDNNGNPLTEMVLYSEEDGMLIDENIYKILSAYIREMFDQHPKEEFAKGVAKRWIIDEERQKAFKEQRLNKNKQKKSFLLPLVSGLVNHPGFKYKTNELKELGIVQFMDSVNRLRVYEQSTAFLKGMYSGMMDTSKMAPDELNKSINWLRDLHED